MGCTTSKSYQSQKKKQLAQQGKQGNQPEKPTQEKPKETDNQQQDLIISNEKKQCLNNCGPEIFISLKSNAISQEYKFGEVLGEGAFGNVRLVKNKVTGIVRAMKSIKKNSIIQEDEQRMFTEVQVLRQCDHPNILKLYELYQDENNYYLVTEYCNGGELFERIKQMDNFSEREAAEYMKQIIWAVYYCHQKNIVHRDLKPENILFESKKPNANLKVIDFGTSRKFEANKKLTKRLGTPYYIAPEVLMKSYDEKCDIWSCGVILYILLCGYPPFNGNDEESIFKAVKEGNFTFDEQDWGNISQEAKVLIKKMLQRDPKKRISAKEAYEDPWIQKNSAKTQINNRVLQNMGQFYAKNKLKSAILTYIATYIVGQQEKEELYKQFRIIDKDGDGQLSREELVEGYMQFYKDRTKAEEVVQMVFEEVDSNKSGKVDFTEFVVAALNKEKLLSKNKIDQAFKVFDRDGNGFIEKEELEQVMGGAYIDDKTWKELLLECDTNNDGKISQNEFLDLLLKRVQKDEKSQ